MMVTELYDALKMAGVDEQIAREAARAVVGAEDRATLATKADLTEARLATKADLLELETRLTWKVITIFGYVTVIYTAINAALRFAKL